MAAALATAAEEISVLPAWKESVAAGRIFQIRTIEVSETSNYMSLLRIWRSIYARFRADGGAGSDIADRMFFKLPMFHKGHPGAVLVAEDERGVAQALTRLRTCSSGLFVEELLVAPWNNTLCVRTVADITDWASKQEELVALAATHKLALAELVRKSPATGTSMMYCICLYATAIKVNKISLCSLRESIPFYWSIGMVQPDHDKRDFYYDLEKGIPKALIAKVAKHFPALASS